MRFCRDACRPASFDNRQRPTADRPQGPGAIDRILKKTPLIDGHNDLPWELRQNHDYRVEELESGADKREKPLMTDMARLRRGG
jgi:membrane dipeptidase